MENGINEMKTLSDEALQSVSGGVDLSPYTMDDLAEIFRYFYATYKDLDVRAEKMSAFGVTEEDILAADLAAVRGGTIDYSPYYLAEMMMNRYA